MKFVISKTELTKLIGNIQNIAGKNTTIPILSNFLIEAAQDELILTATDLTVGMRCHAHAKILEEGATTLPAKRFFQLVRELTTSNIEVTCGENHITEIKAGSSLFKLHGMSKNEFPTLPDLNEAIQIKISCAVLKEMFYRTSFAVSKEENRYVLTGVLLKVADGAATVVGTDGKRLAKTDTKLDIDPTITGDYILPLKAVDEILKILTDEGMATLYLMADKVAVEAHGSTVITKLLSGSYPDFTKVIPKKDNISLSLHREELISLLRQVSLFIDDTLNHAARFMFFNGELTLSANHMEVGEGKVGMPVNYKGPNLVIAFNPFFFLDILRHSKDETVSLRLTDAYNPGLITDSSSSVCVLMPMRLSNEVL